MNPQTALPKVSLPIHYRQLPQGILINDATHINQLTEALFIILEIFVSDHLVKALVFREGLDVFHGFYLESWDF